MRLAVCGVLDKYYLLSLAHWVVEALSAYLPPSHMAMPCFVNIATYLTARLTVNITLRLTVYISTHRQRNAGCKECIFFNVNSLVNIRMQG